MVSQMIIAVVEKLQGTATVKDAEGNTRILQAGDNIYLGDTVQTGDGASITLVYNNQLSQTIAANTLFLADSSILPIALPEEDKPPSDESAAALLAANTQPNFIPPLFIEPPKDGHHPAFTVAYLAPEATVGSGYPTIGINFDSEYPPLDPAIELIHTVEAPILPVSIPPNDPPTIMVTTGNPQGANDEVFEKGLPIGSDPASNTKSASGEFHLFDPQGLSTLISASFNGIVIPIGSLVNTVINGANGNLTITSYDPTTGIGNYTYELLAPTHNFPGLEQDTFTVTTTDGVSTSQEAHIVININDDGPTAVADTDAVLLGESIATGNVVTAAGTTSNGVDIFGADGGAVSGVVAGTDANLDNTGTLDTPIQGAYGKLTLHADGSYEYVPDEETSGSVVDVFTYELKDGDGNKSHATLTISTEKPEPYVFSPPTVGDGSASVYESGLPARGAEPAGSNEAANTETASGTISFTSLKSLSLVSLGGHALGVTESTFTTPLETLKAYYTHDMDTGAGVIYYEYTFLDNTLFDPSGLFLAVLVKNIDGEAAGNLLVNIIDDSPTINVLAAADDLIVDESDLNTDASANFADNFNVVLGADGGIVTYALEVEAEATGLADTATQEAVNLVLNGTIVEGRTASSDDLVFTVSVDANGEVTLNQQRALVHLNSNDPNDAITLLPGLISLVATITDGDGDTAQKSLDLSAGITFYDDGPSIDVEAVADTLVVDESDLGTDASANFADNFNAIPGADGGTVTYALEVAAEATGLTDTATQEAVNLVLNGDIVEGRTASSDDLVFTVSVDANGEVTLNQQRALVHLNSNDPNDAITLLPGLISLVATITDGDGDTAQKSLDLSAGITFYDDGPSIDVEAVADTLVVDESDLSTDASANFADNFNAIPGADGGTVTYALEVAAEATGLTDTATQEAVNLVLNGTIVEGRTASSDDLVFTVSVDANGEVTLNQQRALVHLNSNDPNDAITLLPGLISLVATITDGDGDTAQKSLDLSAGITFYDDGPSIDVEAVADTLVVDESDLSTDASANFADNFNAIPGADGGTVTYALEVAAEATGLTDTATQEAVNLVLNGTIVEGRTASSDDLVFTVSVDANGEVTLNQQRALVHLNSNDPNDAITLLPGLISLVATITDGDGDTAQKSLDLSSGITFYDDGPSIDVEAVADTLVVDESDLSTDASANFADNFNAIPGADGGTVTYALEVAAEATGLTDTATQEAVNLVLNGDIVEGRTASSDDLVFTVSVDANGEVTLNQQRALLHLNSNDPNDAITLLPGLISLVATITDGDGDTAQKSLDLSAGITFYDDGPAIDASAVSLPTLTVDETNFANNATAGFAGNFTVASGNDGLGATTYALSTIGGASNLVDTLSGQAVNLVLVSGAIEGRTAISNLLVFKISVDANGNVTLDQSRAVMHPNASDPDESRTLAGTNLIQLTATTTDGDADSATTTLDITSRFVFKDDGPTIIASAAPLPTLTVDETNFTGNATGSFAGNFIVTSGNDGLGATTYALSTIGGASNLVDTLSGQAVNLVLVSGAIEGRTAISNLEVFKISVDANGNVTLDQSRAVMHPNASDADESRTLVGTNLIQLTATTTDGDADSATTTLDITSRFVFKDDGPTLSATNLAIANIADTYSATYAFNVGADVQPFASSFGAGALTWTNAVTNGALNYDVDNSTAASRIYHGTISGNPFFDVTVKSNGTYDFTLLAPTPVQTVNIDSLLANISGGSNLASYTIGSAAFGGEFDLLLTGYSQGSDTVTISNTELGVSDNVIHGNKDDVLRFDLQPVGGSVASLSSLTIHVASTAGWKYNHYADLTVMYTDGSTSTTQQIFGVDQQLTFTFPSNKVVDWVEITPSGDNAFKIDGVSLSYTQTVYPGNYQLNFELAGSDHDGDIAATPFSVAVNTTATSTYTIQGTSGDDYVYSTVGNDTLTGALGKDAFVWTTEAGAAPLVIDNVSDFSMLQGDVLKLSSILVGVEASPTAASLQNYITVTQSAGNTTFSIDIDGSANGDVVSQQIVLQNVSMPDLAGGAVSPTSNDVITHLLTTQQLVV